jgi:hypothetical protein
MWPYRIATRKTVIPNSLWVRNPLISAVGLADSILSCPAIALATADASSLFYLCVLCVALWQKIFSQKRTQFQNTKNLDIASKTQKWRQKT